MAPASAEARERRTHPSNCRIVFVAGRSFQHSLLSDMYPGASAGIGSHALSSNTACQQVSQVPAASPGQSSCNSSPANGCSKSLQYYHTTSVLQQATSQNTSHTIKKHTVTTDVAPDTTPNTNTNVTAHNWLSARPSACAEVSLSTSLPDVGSPSSSSRTDWPAGTPSGQPSEWPGPMLWTLAPAPL